MFGKQSEFLRVRQQRKDSEQRQKQIELFEINQSKEITTFKTLINNQLLEIANLFRNDDISEIIIEVDKKQLSLFSLAMNSNEYGNLLDYEVVKTPNNPTKFIVRRKVLDFF